MKSARTPKALFNCTQIRSKHSILPVTFAEQVQKVGLPILLRQALLSPLGHTMAGALIAKGRIRLMPAGLEADSFHAISL